MGDEHLKFVADAPLQFAHYDVKSIITSGFKSLRLLTDQRDRSLFNIWAPTIAQNILYAACLDALSNGSSFDVRQKPRVTAIELAKKFGIDFVSPCVEHFLLHSKGGVTHWYPQCEPMEADYDGTLRHAKHLKRLVWQEVEYVDNTIYALDEDEIRDCDGYKVIGFWDALTRVCDGFCYVGKLIVSKPLVLTPHDVAMIETLVDELRNPVAHVRPTVSSMSSEAEIVEAVKVAQRCALYLIAESHATITFSSTEIAVLNSLTVK